jgi:HD-GYP domain-containing protein (c-di-GMP phosphodiesterase class II)
MLPDCSGSPTALSWAPDFGVQVALSYLLHFRKPCEANKAGKFGQARSWRSETYVPESIDKSGQTTPANRSEIMTRPAWPQLWSDPAAFPGLRSYPAVPRDRRALQLAMHEMAASGKSHTETVDHCVRTQRLVCGLAEALKFHPRFAASLGGDAIELIGEAALYHDMGKAAIPAEVLLKPGKLTPDEFETMKHHTVAGRDVVDRAQQRYGEESAFLCYVREIAYCHHEKWDGRGYPQGLSGDAIPISARLMAIADVYDALLSQRVYKAANSHEYALRLIAAARGQHFDPDMTDVFLAIADDLYAIAFGRPGAAQIYAVSHIATRR